MASRVFILGAVVILSLTLFQHYVFDNTSNSVPNFASFRMLSIPKLGNTLNIFGFFRPTESNSSLFSQFWIWLKNSLTVRQPRPSTPNPPQTFQTDWIAGIPVAHHNPFSSYQLAGVALLLHACRQSASDWFTLPEHRRITAELLRHQIAVLAISSSNTVTHCWSTHYPAAQNYDAVRVRLAVRQWIISQGISHTAPFYAIGVSSGAAFLSVIAAAQFIPSLVAQAFYLSAGNLRALKNATDVFPNTLFVRLQHDRYYAPSSVVFTARSTLLARRVPLVAELPMPFEQWNPRSLHDHEPLIPLEASVAIFNCLSECNHEIECAVAVAATKNSSVSDVWNQPHLQRALGQLGRVLSGGHELSAAHADQVVDWLVQHSRNSNHS